MPTYAWTEERKHRQEKMIVQEITEDGEPTVLVDAMPEKYHAETLVIDAREYGIPQRRRRRITCTYDTSELVLTLKLEQFRPFMGRACELQPGSQFCIGMESTDASHEIFEKRAWSKKNKMVSNDANQKWEHILPTYMREHLTAYRAEKDKLVAQGKANIDDACIFDLAHNPTKRRRMCNDAADSSNVTFTTNTILWHDKLARPQLAVETVLAQGFPSWRCSKNVDDCYCCNDYLRKRGQ